MICFSALNILCRVFATLCANNCRRSFCETIILPFDTKIKGLEMMARQGTFVEYAVFAHKTSVDWTTISDGLYL